MGSNRQRAWVDLTGLAYNIRGERGMSRAQGMRIALRIERAKIKELQAKIDDLENEVDYLKGMLEEKEMIA